MQRPDVLQFRTPLRNKDDVSGQGRRRKGKESSGERKGRQRKPSKKLLSQLDDALAARNIDPSLTNLTPEQLKQALKLPSLIKKLQDAGYAVNVSDLTTIDDIIRQIEGPDEGAAGGKRRRGGPGSGPAGSGEPSPIPRGGPRTPRTPVGEEKERPKDDK